MGGCGRYPIELRVWFPIVTSSSYEAGGRDSAPRSWHRRTFTVRAEDGDDPRGVIQLILLLTRLLHERPSDWHQGLPTERGHESQPRIVAISRICPEQPEGKRSRY